MSSPAAAARLGVETIFQDLALVPGLDITANLFLGKEVYGPGRVLRVAKRMHKSEMRLRAAQGFADLGLSLPDPRTRVAALSGGERQAVAIAKAVLSGANIVLMDEPNAALGVKQTEIVLSLVERLRERGVAILFISHNMEQVMRVADRIVVMRLGANHFEAAARDVTIGQLAALVAGVR
jgi:ABC-type sugar transport system ATPase subunit